MATLPKSSVQPLSSYYLDDSTTIACQADQRFSYCTYTPKSWSPETASEFRLLVVVHGSDRAHHAIRKQFVAVAEEQKLIVLSPLFPTGVGDPSDTDNYKYIIFQNLRFDQILLSMVDEVIKRYDMPSANFALFGFSGGAHFAHRFFYLHPERLLALSVASPGSVTRIDDTHDWWVGTKDFASIFGAPIDLATLQKVATQLVVGESDIDTKHITHCPSSPHWIKGANDAGKNRVERLKALHKNWQENGLKSELTILPKVAHTLQPLAQCAADFFKKILSNSD
ncbi:alpha/beta hydrolase [Kordiimonas pumila]|uniref:Alpha/beta hydrolase n=1 Tax=Kordiimonas pumila TaxID=2161677 RepID=A0ABV7D8C8_9PROT|nr:alpha/beta hydrolase [Kordiimonas pumila]